jgi:hypothetical protein
MDTDEFAAFYDRYREHCDWAGIETRSREGVMELVAAWEQMGLVPPIDKLRVSTTRSPVLVAI